MSDRNQDDGDWKPLPPGSLVQYAARQRAQDHRMKTMRAALTLLVVLGAAGLVYQVLPDSPRPQPMAEMHDPIHAGIACSVVRSKLDDYARSALPEDQMRQMQQHLAECPPCRRLLDQLQAAGDGRYRVLIGMAETESGAIVY